MPVNSFDDYPMSWKPKKELLTAPKYRALADLLADDISQVNCHLTQSCLPSGNWQTI